MTAIRAALPTAKQENVTPRLRQKDHKLHVEKNGKRFDLLGNRIR